MIDVIFKGYWNDSVNKFLFSDNDGRDYILDESAVNVCGASKYFYDQLGVKFNFKVKCKDIGGVLFITEIE